MNDNRVYRVWDNQSMQYIASSTGRTVWMHAHHANLIARRENKYRGKRPECVVHAFRLTRVDHANDD